MLNLPQVSPSHYRDRKYDTKERFCCYWHQIDEIISSNPEEVLEIGIGNGFVSHYLRSFEIKVNTVDIDIRLRPTTVSSVLALPFFDKCFDTVACFEVLEHLPFELFKDAIKEIYRVTTSYAIISLPDDRRCYRVNVQLPFFKEIRLLIKIPCVFPRVHYFDGQHFWVVNKKGSTDKSIDSIITSTGFTIVKKFHVYESHAHLFLLLKKSNK